MLNSTYHGAEIADVIVHVVTLAEIATICGINQALACYLPTDPTRNGKGQIWFAATTPTGSTRWSMSTATTWTTSCSTSRTSTTSDIGAGCGIDCDGSRDWFFVRVLGGNLSQTPSAAAATSWENLLPELFAEDFVVLNGIIGWQLSTAPAVKQPCAEGDEVRHRHRPQARTARS